MGDHTSTVVITSDDTLPGVIEHLRTAAQGGRTVHLIVPIDSSLLLTANEFRRLKDAVDEHRLPVVLRTSDPLRLQLGERLGLRVQAAPRPKTATVAGATKMSQQAPALAAAPALPLLPAATQAEPGVPPGPAPDPDAHWPGQNGISGEADGPGAAPSDGDPAVVPSSGPANPPRRWLPVAALLAVLVVAAVLAIRFAVPRAVVRIVPRVEAVEATLVFDVTPDGQALDDQAAFSLKPVTREVDVVWDGTAPVTGVRAVPDGTAGGPIELRNTSGEALTVDAGTVVATEEGVEFSFVEDVTVPAVDAATGEPGAATGSVRAVAAGTGGNVDTGVIGGRLPNGVYYSNRMEPTTGGTDKEFPIVAQADLDALSQAARDAAGTLAADAIAEDGDSSGVLLSSVAVQAQQDTFDHAVDEEAERVALRSEMNVQATFYDESEAEAAYKKALTQQLATAAPEGFAVDPEQIAFDGPVELEEREGGVRLEVAAHVDAVAKLDEAERQELAERLAGASADDAQAVLSEVEEIADVTVDYEPDWLPEQMPNNAGRIVFEVTP